jgi:hypothetical protein
MPWSVPQISVSLFDVSVDAAVSASPVGMFPEQADAPRNEDFHGVGPCDDFWQV